MAAQSYYNKSGKAKDKIKTVVIKGRKDMKRKEMNGQAHMIPTFHHSPLMEGKLSSQIPKRTKNCFTMVNVDQVLTMLNTQTMLQCIHLALDLTQALEIRII